MESQRGERKKPPGVHPPRGFFFYFHRDSGFVRTVADPCRGTRRIEGCLERLTDSAAMP